VNSSTYTTIFILGAGLLALWLEHRLPDLRPGQMLDALLRIGAAMAVNAIIPPTVGTRLTENGLVLVSLFAVALPSLVALFVATIWVMRRFQATLAGRFG
jgi:hypothetical protein